MKHHEAPSNPPLTGDIQDHILYQLNSNNYVTQLFGAQLPTIPTGLLYGHTTKGVIVQPHWHGNANETLYIMAGEVVASLFNPDTQQLLSYKLSPGQVVVFPQGWFHWAVTESDSAQMLFIFDNPNPDTRLGSDFLRFVPPAIMEDAYCIPADAYAAAVAPLQTSVILGPPPGCTIPPMPVRGAEPEASFLTLEQLAAQMPRQTQHPDSGQS